MSAVPASLPAALAVGALAGCAAMLAPEGMAGALMLFGWIVLPTSLVLAARRPEPEMRRLLAIFLAAVFVRLGVALMLAYAAPSHYFAVDDHKYTQLGLELALHWAGEGPYPELLYGRPGYYAWNALLFTLLGEAPLAPVFVNVALGGITCLLAHAVARELGGPRAGLLAALLAAFWPSLVLWQSLNLKDTWVIVALLMSLRGAQRLAGRLNAPAVLQLAFGLSVLGALRGYLAWITGAAVLLAAVLPRVRTSPIVGVAFLATATVLLTQFAPLQELAGEASFESLDRARRGLSLGASAYLTETDISTPGRALRFLPQGLAIFLLAPFPWQILNSRQFLTLPEMLVWYALIPFVVMGLRDALTRRFAQAAPPVFFVAFATVSYALVEGNLGTAYRHRAQVILCFLIFASVSLARRRLPHLGLFERVNPRTPSLPRPMEVRT